MFKSLRNALAARDLGHESVNRIVSSAVGVVLPVSMLVLCKAFRHQADRIEVLAWICRMFDRTNLKSFSDSLPGFLFFAGMLVAGYVIGILLVSGVRAWVRPALYREFAALYRAYREKRDAGPPSRVG